MKRVKITAISIAAAVMLMIGWTTAWSQIHISTDGPPPSMEEIKGLLAAYKAASEQPDMAPRIIEPRAVKEAASAQEIGKPVLRIMPSYYSWPGEESVLWGAVVPDNGVGDFSGNEYTWDFGDGSDPDTGTIENANYIKVQHTYVTAGQKMATLTVKTESETLSKTVKVNVLADNLETRRLKAVEDGLRWLYTQARTDGFIGNNTYRAGETGLAVLAFEEQGHYAISDPDIDIYAPIVKHGLDAIMGTAQKYVFSDYTTPAHPGNSDSNGNGYGIYFLDYLEAAKYTTGVCMLTIIASRTPEEVVEEGQAAGMTYKQVMQDLCDYFAFTQSDTTAFYRGGWRYTPDHTGDGDHSAAQWPALGMMAAEKEWGCFIPQWVKDEVEVWLINTQSTSNFSYGYQGYNSVGLSGAALCQWAFIGADTANERVENTLKYMADNWGSTDARNGHFNSNFYSFYAIAKGFRVLHYPDGHEINLIGDHNWWNEYVDHLVNDETISQKSQESDGKWATGYWNGAGYSFDVPTMQNSLAILVLSPGVFDLPPVAVITGPDGAQPNVNVSLNGAKSYHQDPEKSVVEWLWDFDKSDEIDWNKPDAVGQNVTKIDG